KSKRIIDQFPRSTATCAASVTRSVACAPAGTASARVATTARTAALAPARLVERPFSSCFGRWFMSVLLSPAVATASRCYREVAVEAHELGEVTLRLDVLGEQRLS